jgi:hypothetical protein
MLPPPARIMPMTASFEHAEVGVDDLVPLRVGHKGQHSVAIDPRAIHQAINRPQARFDFREERRHAVAAREVGSHGDGFSICCLNALNHLGGRRLVLVVVNRHAIAAAPERQGDLGSQGSRGPGYQRGFVLCRHRDQNGL